MEKSFRPPSVPLVTVDPYFNVWSAADHLYDDHTRHWTNKSNGMVGIIIIDGKPKRFMGRLSDQDEFELGEQDPDVLIQTHLLVEPVTTKYTFEGEGVELEVHFTTPLLLSDLDLLSRPVTYVSFYVRAVDGQSHQVKIYFDVTGEWCVNTPDQHIKWERQSIEGELITLFMGTVDQPLLQRSGDDTRIDWGYMHLVVPQSKENKTVFHSAASRQQYVSSGVFPSQDDLNQPRAAEDNMPVMAVELDLGTIQSEPESRFLMLAYDDVHSIEYFNEPLDPYWKRQGVTFPEMLLTAAEEYEEIVQRCDRFNQELRSESTLAGGEKYKDILALTYRQSIAAHKLVLDSSGDVLFFSKENFSNGCIATVDVSYPSIPLYLRYNTELVKGMMRPIYKYAKSGDWKFEFAPHDVGTYPKANGQVYGENKLEYQMPIEECGNMLLMAAAVTKYEKHADFAKDHWELLTKWAGYLLQNGLDPENQLCTDDFAGHLAHNTNLSIKAILGIAAYSYMCDMLGIEDGIAYREAAQKMASEWVSMADAGDHYKLTFDSDHNSWSMKYNLVWDQLLGLNLFPKEIAMKELNYYTKRQNEYGVPLDSRDTYTKADWLMWCASMSSSQAQFEQLIAPLWDFMNETSSRVPVTDWYDTIKGTQINFQNRSVVGGFFIQLLMKEQTINLVKSGDRNAETHSNRS
ncbi:glutaminase family protein [Paenibacillus sp. Marseille-Q4541]|uniref:glutaminase family protein n=1 Tax=Paenibacillus sp. Marseille-Q4541 TaxID=2831522 RepID=UPI001BAD16CD|nr:glutaminase family protein [Paenibacillus sp. Marseille-Q4541]